MPKLRRISKTASVRCLVTGEASHGGLYKARWKVRLKVRKLQRRKKAELYQRIRTHLLLHNVFQDYWNAVITLVGILRENGKDIWLADSGKIDDINAVLESVHNPNFPQEKGCGCSV